MIGGLDRLLAASGTRHEPAVAVEKFHLSAEVLKRALIFGFGAGGVELAGQGRRECGVAERPLRRQSNGSPRVARGLAVPAVELDHGIGEDPRQSDEGVGLLRVCVREAGVEADCGIEIFERGLQVGLVLASFAQRNAFQVPVVGAGAVGTAGVAPTPAELEAERIGNAFGDVRLDLEDVARCPVIGLRPALDSVLARDELGRDPDQGRRAAHAPGDDIADIELAGRGHCVRVAHHLR